MWKTRHETVKRPANTGVYGLGVKIMHRNIPDKSISYNLPRFGARLSACIGPVKPKNVHKFLLIYCLSTPAAWVFV
jgi:hypothetical protein